MTEDTARRVDIERASAGRYTVRNVRGGSISVGVGGTTRGDGAADDEIFSPVELLLAAIGCCTAVDVDLVTSRRAEPTRFTVAVTGDKVRDSGGGNRMENLAVTFTVAFPAGPDGDAARQALPRLVQLSHDRLCTVSRTVELGTPVSIDLADGTDVTGPTGLTA